MFEQDIEHERAGTRRRVETGNKRAENDTHQIGLGHELRIRAVQLEHIVYQVGFFTCAASRLMRCQDLRAQCFNPLAGAPHTRRVQQQPRTLVCDLREQQRLCKYDQVIEIFTRGRIGSQRAQLVGDNALERVQARDRRVAWPRCNFALGNGDGIRNVFLNGGTRIAIPQHSAETEVLLTIHAY